MNDDLSGENVPSQDRLAWWKWQALIIKAPIPEVLKLTYITLRNFDSVNGCYPKLETVADRRGLSARTVKRHIAALRKHGYLFSQQSRGPSQYWFTNTEGGPGEYEVKDLLLYALEPIGQINSDTPKDVPVCDVPVRSDTSKDGTSKSDTPKDGTTEVAVEVAVEVQNYKDLTETGQLPTASRGASTDQANGNGEQLPVKSPQQTAGDGDGRQGEEQGGNGRRTPTEEEVREVEAILESRGTGGLHPDNTAETQARHLLANHDLADCKAALGVR